MIHEVQDTGKTESDGMDQAPTESKEVQHLQDSSSEEQIQQRLHELESQNIALRQKLWQSQNKGPLSTGIILLSIGAVILMFSFLSNLTILAFIGLGITLWGLLLIYISPSRHVRAELLNSVSSSIQKCFDSLVTYMGYSGEVIFFHPKSLTGLGQGYVFIPHYVARLEANPSAKLDALNLLPYSNETNIPSTYLTPKGVFLTAPSQGLVDLFEKELEVNFALVNLEYIQEALPKLLVEDLKMADDMSIEKYEDGNILVKVTDGPCTEMCRFVSNHTRLGNHLGCPLCSALALVISKVSARPVIIKETNILDNVISTTYSELNP